MGGGFEAGEDEEIVDKLVQAIALGGDAGEETLAIGAGHAGVVEEGADDGGDGGERGLEFVGNVGGEGAADLLEATQFGEIVEDKEHAEGGVAGIDERGGGDGEDAIVGVGLEADLAGDAAGLVAGALVEIEDGREGEPTGDGGIGRGGEVEGEEFGGDAINVGDGAAGADGDDAIGHGGEDGGETLALALFDEDAALDVGGHGIDGGGDEADLVGAAGIDAGGEVAGGELAADLGDAGKGVGVVAGEKEAEGEGDEGAERGAGGDATAEVAAAGGEAFEGHADANEAGDLELDENGDGEEEGAVADIGGVGAGGGAAAMAAGGVDLGEGDPSGGSEGGEGGAGIGEEAAVGEEEGEVEIGLAGDIADIGR